MAMRNLTTPIIVVAALVVVIAAPFLVRVFKPDAQADAMPKSDKPADRLVILTPHNEAIRNAFALAFSRHRVEAGHPPVEIDWRVGGTSDLRRTLLDQFSAKGRDGAADDGVGVDVFFGGGPYDHNKLVGGARAEVDGKTVKVRVVEPMPVDKAFMADAYEQSEIGGEPLYVTADLDGDGEANDVAWLGTALSSFGIVYNRDVLRDVLRMPEPTTWSDLGDPKLRGWVALADPGHSSSVTVTFDTILRRKGWDGGWAALRRAFANARYFAATSSKPPVDVADGQAAAGMCIAFYGRFQAGHVPGDRIGYVDPPFMTSITADPVTLLRGGPSLMQTRENGRPDSDALSFAFVRFVLSKDGQRLWQRKVGTPGGPTRFALRRVPIRKDIYTDEEREHWTDPTIDPYGIARPVAKGMPSFFSLIEPVTHAMAVDNHEQLQAAWDAICDHPEHPRRAEMLALFDAMPSDLRVDWPAGVKGEDAESIIREGGPQLEAVTGALASHVAAIAKRWEDSDTKLRDRQRWTAYFRNNYRAIVEMARGR